MLAQGEIARLARVCRGCGRGLLRVVLSLGDQPPANAFVPPGDPDPGRYPLELAVCDACGLTQLTVSLDPDYLFGTYPYFSSVAQTMVEHARVLAEQTIARRNLDHNSLVVEIASNDGYLLRHYAARGIPVLGIEPARNVAAAAEAAGIPTRCAFFGLDLAAKLAAEGIRADVVHANNVLAHVPDLNGVVAGVAQILAPNGMFVVETPSLADLVEGLAFDTIYHEHIFYFSAASLCSVLERNGLAVTAIESIPVHGGSLRVSAVRRDGRQPMPADVARRIREEQAAGLTSSGGFAGFSDRVASARARLRRTVTDLVTSGRRVVAYGASAKGTVLLNACSFGPDDIPWVADRNPQKVGRLVPGVRIPVVEPARILEDRPDVVLILARNLTDEILRQQQAYVESGGRFLVPLPDPAFVP